MKYLAILILLSSCSASFHLKQAIKKGGKVKTDTTYVDVITERTVTDTVALLSEVTKNDTIIVNTTRWLSKIYIKNDTIWQEVDCKPDTVKVPVLVTQKITAPPKRHFWQYLLIGIVTGLIVMGLLRR